jgi:hypothetical protein
MRFFIRKVIAGNGLVCSRSLLRFASRGKQLARPSRRLKVSKFWNHPERRDRRSKGFSNLLDVRRRRVSEESRTLVNVSQVSGFKPHQSCAGSIGSH